MEEKLEFESIDNLGWVEWDVAIVEDKVDGQRLAFYKEELLPLAAFLIAAYNRINQPQTCGCRAQNTGKCYGCGFGFTQSDQD